MANGGSATRRKPRRSTGEHTTDAAKPKPEVTDGRAHATPALVGGVLGAAVLLFFVVPEWLGVPWSAANSALGRRSARKWSPDVVDENKNLSPDPLEVLRERYNVSLLNVDPPIYQFEDFLSAEEADGLAALAAGRFQKSTTGLNRDRTDPSRTSSTAWLISPEDYANPLVQRIENRMAAAMNVPAINQEGFQVLEYDHGQYYRTHHDYLPEMASWPCGVRLATFFLYLTDVEEGGGTFFPRLNITGVPKKGRALLWYNLNKAADGSFTTQLDPKTHHEAQPVIKGVKIAANKWVHVKDWVTPWRAGRTG